MHASAAACTMVCSIMACTSAGDAQMTSTEGSVGGQTTQQTNSCS
jgi:hypothetical protein